jgi:class 3 adenylate cyclase
MKSKSLEINQIVEPVTTSYVRKTIAESRVRILKLLSKNNNRNYFSANTKSSEIFLHFHKGSKVNLVILYVDLVDSTHMSTILELADLVMILQIFMQEMSIIAVKNHGHILKYVGDAMIVYFPVTENDFSSATNNAILCASNMLLVLDQGINSVFKELGYPKLGIKIGIDSGENAIVEYIFSRKKSHMDIVGYPMNMAAKNTSLAKPNHILIGTITYSYLGPERKDYLEKFALENGGRIDYQNTYGVFRCPLDSFIQ